jgi:hypothetical protein
MHRAPEQGISGTKKKKKKKVKVVFRSPIKIPFSRKLALARKWELISIAQETLNLNQFTMFLARASSPFEKSDLPTSMKDVRPPIHDLKMKSIPEVRDPARTSVDCSSRSNDLFSLSHDASMVDSLDHSDVS